MRKIIIGLSCAVSLFASIKSEVLHDRFKKSQDKVTDTWVNLILEDSYHSGDGTSSWRSSPHEMLTYNEAINYCNNLSIGNNNNFRIPTDSELQYITTIKKQIKSASGLAYWSSTNKDKDTMLTRWFSSGEQGSANINKNKKKWLGKYPIRCVEGNKYTSFNTIVNKVQNTYNDNILQLNTKIFNTVKSKNTIDSYRKFTINYPDSIHINKVKKLLNREYNIKYTDAYKLAKSKNTIEKYQWFINKHAKSSKVQDAIQEIFKLIKKQNNITGYKWFIKEYSQAPQVKDAIKNIHKLAYNKAKSINTISSYNTFIYLYPYASEVKEANDEAYKIEIKKYTDLGMLGFFGKEDKMEKKARKLLIKAKQIERTSQDYSGNSKAGYIIVANRMYDLLQEKFDDSEATLRHLESQEFKDFVRSFKSIMGDIKYTLNKINSNVSDIGHYAKQMVDVSKKGLADAKADRAMTAYHEKKKTEWNKFMHFRDKGYN